MKPRKQIGQRPGTILFTLLIGVVAGFILCLYVMGNLLPSSTTRVIVINLAAVLVNLIFLVKTRNIGYIIIMFLCIIQLIQ